MSAAGIRLMSAACVTAVRIARSHAAAVDQGQGAVRTEIAKVDFGGARGAVRESGVLVGGGRRKLRQDVLNAAGAGELDVLVGDDRDRSSGLEVRLRNAAAGDDDVLRSAHRSALGVGARRRLRRNRASRRSLRWPEQRKSRVGRAGRPAQMPAWPACLRRPEGSLSVGADDNRASYLIPVQLPNAPQGRRRTAKRFAELGRLVGESWGAMQRFGVGTSKSSNERSNSATPAIGSGIGLPASLGGQLASPPRHCPGGLEPAGASDVLASFSKA